MLVHNSFWGNAVTTFLLSVQLNACGCVWYSWRHCPRRRKEAWWQKQASTIQFGYCTIMTNGINISPLNDVGSDDNVHSILRCLKAREYVILYTCTINTMVCASVCPYWPYRPISHTHTNTVPTLQWTMPTLYVYVKLRLLCNTTITGFEVAMPCHCKFVQIVQIANLQIFLLCSILLAKVSRPDPRTGAELPLLANSCYFDRHCKSSQRPPQPHSPQYTVSPHPLVSSHHCEIALGDIRGVSMCSILLGHT